MKKVLLIALTLMICAACLTSCASIEQEIGKKVSVAAVEAVAAGLEEQGVAYQLADEAELAEIEAEIASQLENGLQGELTAAIVQEYADTETGDWTLYWVYGFSSTADAEAYAQLVTQGYQALIDEGKAIVVMGGYIVSVTASSMVIEQE